LRTRPAGPVLAGVFSDRLPAAARRQANAGRVHATTRPGAGAAAVRLHVVGRLSNQVAGVGEGRLAAHGASGRLPGLLHAAQWVSDLPDPALAAASHSGAAQAAGDDVRRAAAADNAASAAARFAAAAGGAVRM